ncbi:MAG: hypothetical protein A3I66_04480 [Burkholderiales bacterium RIFCSPLOWO2_02_FULL_57_36]|nr:MAG: hypothetical protein A3I66_04480 [Burkholderiales bacterium RIFCSPLOWO2_02_FULL_57_36]
MRTAGNSLAERFKGKRKVRFAIERNDRIHRISVGRLVTLKQWLNHELLLSSGSGHSILKAIGNTRPETVRDEVLSKPVIRGLNVL